MTELYELELEACARLLILSSSENPTKVRHLSANPRRIASLRRVRTRDLPPLLLAGL